MDLQQIEKLVQIIENSSMLEFSIQEGDTKIKMSRRGTMGVPGEQQSPLHRLLLLPRLKKKQRTKPTSPPRSSAPSIPLRLRKQKPS